ncbi:MAG TPA: roadblock/LC7 domain-containing protein [Streptosporangiaceae bacterium]
MIIPPNQDSDPAWLLRNLAQRVPHTRSVVLLSSDGLPKACHGLDPDGADQLAAMAAPIWSLARTAAQKFDDSDVVRQVVAELNEATLFVSSAGFGSVLAVLADRSADPSVLGYEMAQLIKSVRPFLATPARPVAAAHRDSTSPG